MKREVSSAVDFLTQLMRKQAKNEEHLSNFNDILKLRICEHYENHWFPEKSFKGSGYRCLRINHNMEPVILQAAKECGYTKEDLIAMLPTDLTLWIDPREVSYRIGEDGSVGILYEEEAMDNSQKTKASNQSTSVQPLLPVQQRSPVLSPATSPARSPVNSRAHTPQHLSPSRPSSVNSVGSGEVSWDVLLDPSNFSPSRFQLAQQHFQQQFNNQQFQQQQCSREAYFHQQANLNDSYDLKRLAAYVYS